MARYKKTVRNGHEYWYVTRVLGRKLNDKGKLVPVKKTFYGKTQKELDEKVTRAMTRFGLADDPAPRYFCEVFEAWYKDFFLVDSSLSSGTKSTYSRYWECYRDYADFYILPVDNVKPSMIQRFYNELVHTFCVPSSAVRKIHNLLRRFYRYLALNGLAEDRTDSLIVPKNASLIEKDEADIVIWEDYELKRIMAGLDSAPDYFRLRFLIVLMANTGVRIGEALGVSRYDIDEQGLHIRRQVQEKGIIENGTISNEPVIANVKTPSSRRLIPLNSLTREELQKHLEWQEKDSQKNGYENKLTDGRLFTTSSGHYYDKKNVRRALDRYYDLVKVPHKGPHTYRHTFGTKLCKNGVGIEVAAALMGHESIETTAKYYVRVDDARKAEAVETLY